MAERAHRGMSRSIWLMAKILAYSGKVHLMVKETFSSVISVLAEGARRAALDTTLARSVSIIQAISLIMIISSGSRFEC
jgi:hypothetical protein